MLKSTRRTTIKFRRATRQQLHNTIACTPLARRLLDLNREIAGRGTRR